MATNLYNYENQKLSAEELRLINSFNSYNYAGIVGSSSPFTYSDYTVTLNASSSSPVLLLGGGLLLSQEDNLTLDMTSDKRLAYLRVTLDESNGSIISNEYSGIILTYATCNSITFNKSYTIYTVVTEASGSPADNNYYEYADDTYTVSTDTEVDTSKTYYFKFTSSNFSFQADDFGSTYYTYNGNTIWIDSNVFIIPLLIRNGNTGVATDDIQEVVSIKNLRDFEGFLSLEAYSALKKYCEGTFVWTIGGEETITDLDGNTHKKGDIGGLNITDTTIRNNLNSGSEAEPIYKAPVTFSNISLPNLIETDETGTFSLLYIDSEGQLQRESNRRLTVAEGGTYVSTNWDTTRPRLSAKKNLGISYGTADPTSTYPFSPAVEGDIYLKIIE